MADKNIGAYDSAPFTSQTRLVAVPFSGPSANVDPVLIDPDEVFPVEISTVVTGGAASGELLWSYIATREIVLPVGLSNSLGKCTAEDDVTGSFSIDLNGSTVGTVDLTASVVSFTFSLARALSPGDVLSLISNGDMLFDSVALSIRAIRN